MRFSDTLSIGALVVVLGMLIHTARTGPVEPVLRAMHLAPSVTAERTLSEPTVPRLTGDTPVAPTAHTHHAARTIARQR